MERTLPRSEAAVAPIAFEAIHALPGFCQLLKRSPTLDGLLQLRAAQHCSPVFEGNEAGFQISLEQPLRLYRKRGQIHVDMTATAFKQTREDVRAAVDRLVEEGLLLRGGYWQRLLRADAMPLVGNRLLLWSGFLVRPAPGVALRIGQAFNRRSRVTVIEHAIVDHERFTPLMLEIDASRLDQHPLFVHEEIGCVLPVAPRARMKLASLGRVPEVVKSLEAFADAAYLKSKLTNPTGKYRRMIRATADVPEAEDCEATVGWAGPAVHEIATLKRFHGPRGISTGAPRGVRLPSCTVRNVGRVGTDWDGQMFTDYSRSLKTQVAKLSRDWTRAGGDVSSGAFESLSRYLNGTRRDEPILQLTPWAFCVTPPGWSTVVDAGVVGGADGMRGVIWTDHFHTLQLVYRLFTPGSLFLRRGARLGSFYPIPRRLQRAGMRIVDSAVS